MALYAIGDLHLSLSTNKPMDVFGGAWSGYMEKLKEGLSVITEEDTTILLGDLSWALGMDAAEADFAFINSIPGRKLIIKGNHDYWWSTASKFRKFCEEKNFSNMEISRCAEPVDGFTKRIAAVHMMKKYSSGNCAGWRHL